MISDVFHEFGVFDFAFVPSDCIGTGNLRLREKIPHGTNAIFFLMPYYVKNASSDLSHFAAVRDYHLLAKMIFSRLDSYFEEKYPNVFHMGFADHSPFAECVGASMAGLGMIGENSLLITEKYSSFVCIGEYVCALTEKELLSENITKGDGEITFCEKCHACANMCPSECAGKTGRELCVSAISQKKGELTFSEAELLKKSGFVWGCDVCQNVCPHTKAALESGTLYTEIGFFKDGVIDDLSKIEKLTDEEFCQYPFSWRKREIIERNIKISKEGGSGE